MVEVKIEFSLKQYGDLGRLVFHMTVAKKIMFPIATESREDYLGFLFCFVFLNKDLKALLPPEVNWRVLF